jgi:hypothetical protein
VAYFEEPREGSEYSVSSYISIIYSAFRLIRHSGPRGGYANICTFLGQEVLRFSPLAWVIHSRPRQHPRRMAAARVDSRASRLGKKAEDQFLRGLKSPACWREMRNLPARCRRYKERGKAGVGNSFLPRLLRRRSGAPRTGAEHPDYCPKVITPKVPLA